MAQMSVIQSLYIYNLTLLLGVSLLSGFIAVWSLPIVYIYSILFLNRLVARSPLSPTSPRQFWQLSTAYPWRDHCTARYHYCSRFWMSRNTHTTPLFRCTSLWLAPTRPACWLGHNASNFRIRAYSAYISYRYWVGKSWGCIRAKIFWVETI